MKMAVHLFGLEKQIGFLQMVGNNPSVKLITATKIKVDGFEGDVVLAGKVGGEVEHADEFFGRAKAGEHVEVGGVQANAPPAHEVEQATALPGCVAFTVLDEDGPGGKKGDAAPDGAGLPGVDRAQVQDRVGRVGVAGEGDDTSLAVLQPFFFVQLGKGTYLRMAPLWVFDLENESYNVPLGFGIGKVVKPGQTVFNIFIEPQFTVLHDGIGQPELQIFAGLNMQFLPK